MTKITVAVPFNDPASPESVKDIMAQKLTRYILQSSIIDGKKRVMSFTPYCTRSLDSFDVTYILEVISEEIHEDIK